MHPPTRLTHAQYLPEDMPLRMYHQFLDEPVALHWHEFYELSFFVQGEGSHILNGTEYPLKPGSLFLLTPADFHRLTPLSGHQLEIFNVIFSSTMLKPEVYQFLFQSVQDYVAFFAEEHLTSMHSEFCRLWREIQDPQPGGSWVITSTLERILIDLLRVCMSSGKTTSSLQPSAQQQCVHMALVYLHHHFREPLTLQIVARQVHLSPNYFSECFHKTYGCSFQRYLQDLRLTFAQSLLSISQLPVTDICFASGFQTLSHFERAFKHKFGLAPRLYRERQRT